MNVRRLLKRLPLRGAWTYWLAYHVGVPVLYRIVKMISTTWKTDRVGEERGQMKPAIFAIWHGDLIVAAYELPRLLPRVDVLTSRSRDGTLVARFVHCFRGARTIRGGSSKGGTGALLGMVRSLKQGRAIVIPVDGPRGPFSEVKPGIIVAASETGAPIVAGAVLTDKAWRFRSWDRMFVCKPHARVRLIYGEPFYVKPDLTKAEIEQERARLEQAMMELHRAADGLIGSNDGPAGKAKVVR